MADPEHVWAFRGRTDELRRASAALAGATPRGVVIVGSAGVGKSRMAAEVAGRVSGRSTVLFVGATEAASSMPFGAFAHLLPPLTVGREPDRLSLFGRVVGELTARAAGRRLVMVIDDAHLLDPGGAALALHLARSGTAAIVLTVRAGEPVSDAIAALWKDGLAERIDLGPLGRTEHDAVLADALGAPLGIDAAAALWKVTLGNPLFVREVIEALRAEGRLRAVDGRWTWDGDLPATARLVDLVEARVGRLEPSLRRGLEVVALAEPIGARLAAGVVGEDVLVGLERAGLVRVVRDDRREEVSVVHPLYGEVLRALVPWATRRRALRSVAEAVEATGARRREDLLRLAVWRLEAADAADGAGDPALLADAAMRATRTFDPVLGERLARASLAAGGGAAAGLALAEALNLRRRPAEAEEVLASWWHELVVDDPELGRAAAFQRVLSLHFGADRSDEADRHLVGLRGLHPDPWDQQVQGLRSLVLASTDMDEAVALASPLVDDASADPWARHFAVHPVVIHHSFAGATDRALAILGPFLGEALALVDQFPHGPAWIMTLRGRTLGNAGRFDEIEAMTTVLRQVAETTGDDQSMGGALMGLGVRAYYGGELHRADELLSASLRLLDVTDLAGLRPWTLAVHTMTCAALGDVDKTRRAHAALETAVAEASDSPLSRAEVAGATAWAMAAVDGDVAGGAAHATSAARRSTLRLHQAMLWVIAHRLGAPDDVVAEPLATATAGTESVMLDAYHSHAEALRAGRPAKALEGVAATYADVGLMIHAAEAWVEASEAHRSAGDAAASRRASGRALALLAGPVSGARTPILARLATPTLTAREREVARWAAAGRSNAEIAEQLSVSVRTIEWHVAQVFTKLGVTRRTQLADVLDPPPSDA